MKLTANQKALCRNHQVDTHQLHQQQAAGV
jgi:hypothetical protein